MDKTFLKRLLAGPLLFSVAAAVAMGSASAPLRAQTGPVPEAAQAEAEEAPMPLSPEEMDILVARIALYPDELVALISAASLYPLQIVEAERFLDNSKAKKGLNPKAAWDGSVISLLNYPEIVRMMADDLDWTQLFGQSIVNQQEDVLNSIQQLREQAVANGVIKTDSKVKVTKEADNGRQNIIIAPASSEVIYVPQYQPEMLYEPDYAYVPVSYYPDPYPYYWNPAAAFFAGAVTGAIWTAAVDWDNGFWGWGWNNHWHGNGNNWGNDIDIDCNKCIIGSDFNGKLNINNIDWRNVDRSKIKYDKNQFNKLSNTNIRNEVRKNDLTNFDRNKLGNNKTGSNNKGNLQRPATLPAKGGLQTKDIRKSTLEGLNKKPVQGFKPTDKMARPGNGGDIGGLGGGNLAKPGTGNPGGKPDKGNLGNLVKPGTGGMNVGDMARPADKMAKPNLDRPVGKPRPGATKDVRPPMPSPMGEVTRGRDAQMQSMRGNKSMGGGGINRPDFNPGGGGGGKIKGGGGGGGKKFVPANRGGGGGGGGGRGRRR
ncbi:MAG: DUF3300 domain-containing protein [Aestuariivirga sp.]|uniref:DUF3300 domain-containing protein n=1 Tax=Aestuariivirga sp. TaxID=2650926 RepID=UPI0025B930A8|nr:DUF3300 domain-containing protein [Aestuariivirga sp.]MCA3560721.1 DUF3300 domain-containing protein [Aestuariivirga sp.]